MPAAERCRMREWVKKSFNQPAELRRQGDSLLWLWEDPPVQSLPLCWPGACLNTKTCLLASYQVHVITWAPWNILSRERCLEFFDSIHAITHSVNAYIILTPQAAFCLKNKNKNSSVFCPHVKPRYSEYSLEVNRFCLKKKRKEGPFSIAFTPCHSPCPTP